MSTYVIAEPGCTHEGSFEAMCELIKEAASAGCNAFKHQWMSDPEAVCRRRNAPEYLASYQWLTYPIHWHTHFKALCASLGMDYGCSTYTPTDAAAIEDYVDFHKIASFENEVSSWHTAKPLYVGAGMLSHEALNCLIAMAAPNVRILQCTSKYPTPVNAMHLATIRQYRLAGLSDHSARITTGGYAVCAGAKTIEVHIRLDTCSELNPDYPVALAPGQLRVYVEDIRLAERIMGHPLKAIQPCEQQMLAYKVTA